MIVHAVNKKGPVVTINDIVFFPGIILEPTYVNINNNPSNIDVYVMNGNSMDFIDDTNIIIRSNPQPNNIDENKVINHVLLKSLLDNVVGIGF